MDQENLQLLSCSACDYDICKYCREAQAHNSPSCTHSNENNFTSFLVFSKLRKDLTCSYCYDKNKDGMWYCSKDCDYTICTACNLKNEIKCSKNHLLQFDNTQFECSFCDNEQGCFPSMKCGQENCEFSICLECCAKSKNYRDEKHHILYDQTKERLHDKVVCSFCKQFNPKVPPYHCEFCKIDICKSCLDDEKNHFSL